MKFRITKLDPDSQFRLRIMDAYFRMKKEGKVDVRKLCKLFGIGKSAFYKWKGRYNPYNLNTLKSQSRKPIKTNTIPWNLVVEICEWKREKRNRKKSHYYLYQLWLKQGKTPPCSSKTIYNWWKKRGLIDTNRRKRKRRDTKLFNQAQSPGELVQIDVKYLEGRSRFQYTAIDVTSKWRYARVYTKFNQENSIDFVDRLVIKAKEKGIGIRRIQTDNGSEFQSEFVTHLTRRSIRHQYIWIHTPDQNGCVERSHRTDEEEFYQEEETKDMSLEELNQALEEWIAYYNSQRLHFSLNFDTPEEYLQKTLKVSTI